MFLDLVRKILDGWGRHKGNSLSRIHFTLRYLRQSSELTRRWIQCWSWYGMGPVEIAGKYKMLNFEDVIKNHRILRQEGIIAVFSLGF